MREQILVVDDEKEIADLVTLYLENEGFRVFKFYSSEKALECINSQSIDLAVLDIMMPVIDGLKLCRKIREQSYYHAHGKRNRNRQDYRTYPWSR